MAYADQHRSELEVKAADEVLFSTTNLALKGVDTEQLMAKCIGPYKVLTWISFVAYGLELPGNVKVHNLCVNTLKGWRSNGNYQHTHFANMITAGGFVEAAFKHCKWRCYIARHANLGKPAFQYNS